MHNYRRQKKMTAAQTKLDIQDVEIRTGEYDAEAVVQVLESPLVLSSEPWGWDPFDSFPIKMQPYMHELLYLCKSTPPLFRSAFLCAEYNTISTV